MHSNHNLDIRARICDIVESSAKRFDFVSGKGPASMQLLYSTTDPLLDRKLRAAVKFKLKAHCLSVVSKIQNMITNSPHKEFTINFVHDFQSFLAFFKHVVSYQKWSIIGQKNNHSSKFCSKTKCFSQV